MFKYYVVHTCTYIGPIWIDSIMVKKISDKSYKKGRLILQEIKYDHVFKRTVMKSHKGTIGKIYLPKELIGKSVYVVVDLNNLNE